MVRSAVRWSHSSPHAVIRFTRCSGSSQRHCRRTRRSSPATARTRKPRRKRCRAPLARYPAAPPHSSPYVPDFARALVSLVDAPDDAYGEAWHVPNAPAASLREALHLAADLIGVRRRVTVLPQALMPLLGLFSA